MNNNSKKVVIYVRYSSQRQGEISVDKQLTECYRYCNANGFKVVKEYVDVSDSAKSDTRPQFMQMINDSNNREFEGVIVYSFGRFSSNGCESAIYKTKLKNNGIKVYIANTGTADYYSGIIQESMSECFIKYLSNNKEILKDLLEIQEANLNNEQ